MDLDGFSTVWHRFRETLVEEGAIPRDLTLKGLRHTVATILREIGMTLRQSADLPGQQTESMALQYSRDANLAEGNRKTMDKLQAEIARRTRIVKPEAGTRQTRQQRKA